MNAPNISKYICKKGVTNNDTKLNGNKYPIKTYSKPMMIEPPSMFPNKRRVNEKGKAKSPTTFNGNKNETGSKYPFIFATIP